MTLGVSQRWYAGAAIAAVLVLLSGWFLLVAPQKSSAEEIGVQADAKQSANHQTELEIASLKAQFKGLPALQKQAAMMRSRMPQTIDGPALLRTLSTNAKAAGLTLSLVTAQKPAPVGNGSGQAVAGASLVSTPGQVNQMTLTLNVVGRFANLRLFVKSLEEMNRSMLVTNLDISRNDSTAGSSSDVLKAQITGRVFMANPGMPSVAAPPSTSTTDSGTASTAGSAS
jgi:Tfp pilus assembly protein PilO